MTGTAIGGPVRLADGIAIPLSSVMRAGDFVFVSGQVPFDAEFNVVGDDIETQTRAVLERLKQTLQAAGCDLGNVVKTTVWLTRRRDFGRFNAVYAEYFPEAPPARSTVCADLEHVRALWNYSAGGIFRHDQEGPDGRIGNTVPIAFRAPDAVMAKKAPALMGCAPRGHPRRCHPCPMSHIALRTAPCGLAPPNATELMPYDRKAL